MQTIKFNGIKDLSDLEGKSLLFTPKLNLSGIVDPKFLHRHYSKYAYIPSRILISLASDKRLGGNPENWTRISSKDICLHHTTRFYKKITDDLLAAGVIQRGHYSLGEHPFEYRLGAEYADFEELEIIPVPKNETRSEIGLDPKDIIQFLNSNIARLCLDTKAFDNAFAEYSSSTGTTIPTPYVFTSSQPNLDAKYSLKEKIESKYRLLKDVINLCRIASSVYNEVYRDNTSFRVHSVLTNLRSDLRGFLKIRDLDEGLELIDLCNSQVFLVNLLLKERYKDFDQRTDLKLFYELTSGGQFYEFLMEKMNGLDRDRIKKEFFANYFFCKIRKRENQYSKIMKELFPSIDEYVRDEKKEKHNRFAIKLQQAESNFFIDKIVPRLMTELPPHSFVATIHDSIMTNMSCADQVESILKDEFAKESLRPTFKRKSLKINREIQVMEELSPPVRLEFDVADGGTGGQGDLSEAEGPEVLPSPYFSFDRKIRKVPESFKLNDWRYKLIFRESDVVIYEMTKNGISAYEVHKIRLKKPRKNKDVDAAPPFGGISNYLVEVRASDEEFGTFGWAFYNLERALAKSMTLLNKDRSLTGGVCENSIERIATA
jgi:hypothetical protein